MTGWIKSVMLHHFQASLEDLEPDDELKKLYSKTHQTIKKVSNDIEERFHFNTAISAVMELINAMYGFNVESAHPHAAGVMRFCVESVILLLSPIVPHFAEELWQEFRPSCRRIIQCSLADI